MTCIAPITVNGTGIDSNGRSEHPEWYRIYYEDDLWCDQIDICDDDDDEITSKNMFRTGEAVSSGPSR